MKKTLLTALLVFAGFTAQAQLANGSIAPDFTGTDLDGNVHTLSEYLAQGKTVILDISATWCGPCWLYHETNALADLYESYGMGGSEEVIVLFIEGDPQTNNNNLHGISGPRATQGNWIEHSPYPIIDDASIADLYEIEYFPTIYRICPNGIINEIDAQAVTTAALLRSNINTNCGTLTGAQNHAMVTANNARVCEAGGYANVTAKIRNYGANRILNANLALKENGTTIATQTFTGSVASLSLTNMPTVTFSNVPLLTIPDATYSVEITDINSAAPYNNYHTTDAIEVATARSSGNVIQVDVHTDNYPGEISWQIVNTAGTVLGSGGPYEPGTEDQYGAGGDDANTTISQTITLPEGSSECYSLVLLDEFNDGWTFGPTPHGIEIFSGDTSIFNYNAGNFGGSLTIPSAFKVEEVLTTPTTTLTKFAAYPNPTTGILNFSTKEQVDVTILDITGKTVYTAKGVTNGSSINLGSLQKGIYIAQIKGNEISRTEKIILQ